MTTEVIHQFRDPSKLTPYEERLLNLRNQGMTYGQMSQTLERSCKPNTIAARFKIIKEKLEVIEALACGDAG
jgi:DNA-binding CsgD family transcriptional regulator